jgi:uncharacterized protein YbcC (UPF0753/DUF2309 family)
MNDSRLAAVQRAVDHGSDLLPHQDILENFVHRNPLKHFEDMDFRAALDLAHTLEAFPSPGLRVKALTGADPRKRASEAAVELCSVFLDRGAAKWGAGFRQRGFLNFFAQLEGLGFARWRVHARRVAKQVRAPLGALDPADTVHLRERSAELLRENLEHFGVPEAEWTNAVRAMMLELRGWAGMFHAMESRPGQSPPDTAVRLLDFVAVYSTLLRSSIDQMARQADWDPSEESLGAWLARAQPDAISAAAESSSLEEHQHTSAIAYVDQHSDRREVLEEIFEAQLLHTLCAHAPPPKMHAPSGAPTPAPRPRLQFYTCIDDRECSFRRHVEESDPEHIETFGVAGFFGVPIRYRDLDGGAESQVLAPDGAETQGDMVESERKGLDAEQHRQFEQYLRRKRGIARVVRAFENASFSPLGSIALSALFPVSMTRLMLTGLAPGFKATLDEYLRKRFLARPQTDIALPFAAEQGAVLLARTFRDVGTHDRFAPLVVVLGHGAVSVNNPFASAYNCGACGGREGGPNARLLARLANDPDVRGHLHTSHGIDIPADTLFIGGMHNTTSDQLTYYDTEALPETHRALFEEARSISENAVAQNALERCRRFLLAEDVHCPDDALRHVRMRANDAAEVRPELNHATNAAVVIGRRRLTEGSFLDRRVFLPSYDPEVDDSEGTNLEHVLGPALHVCSGINLEYLFSTIDADHHGAGTKAPLNVVGNIGVLQGTSGDLRLGLPSQMTEFHVPVRALFVVEAPPSRIEAVLARRADLRSIVRNEWVRLVARDPDTGRLYRQDRGDYHMLDTPHPTADTNAPLLHHLRYGMSVAHREDMVFKASSLAMVAAGALPVYAQLHSAAAAMNPYGPLIAGCGTALALPVLAFSRRYLHGEFMFGRIAALQVGLLLGFNLVATATSMEQVLAGWSLFGFASTFLIGAYNDRPTVRNNATYAFAAYRVSDFALITAAAFGGHYLESGGTLPLEHPSVVAGGLLLAALFKSSQFPLTALFARSMEGPTPASALGYAGLSAHVGVVLLSSTMPLWYELEWARAALGGIGLFTAGYAGLVSKTRADRKGAIAYATSATLGLIYLTLALGHPHLALAMSLGHSSFRMLQTLRAPNMIADSQALRNALGKAPWPKIVPDWLFRQSWRLRRLDTDVHLLNVLNWMTRRVSLSKTWKPSKAQQLLLTGAGVTLAGAPFTPVAEGLDAVLMSLLHTNPVLAGALMVGHFGLSAMLVRFLFVNVLSKNRFKIPRLATPHSHSQSSTSH